MSNITTYKHAENLPSFLRAFQVSTELIAGSAGFGLISIKGKVFTMVNGEDRQLITKPDAPDEPAASLDAIIIKANPGTSKTYYATGYVEGSTEKPDCYSNDGIAPAADAAEPQSTKCATCPHNAWGSRMSEDGKQGKECADVKRLAVALVNDTKTPLLLRVPAASLKPLTQYADKLVRSGAPYQAVVTKIGFDYSVAHPALTFRPARFITEQEFKDVQELLSSPVVMQITGEAPSAAAAAAEPKQAAPQPKAEAAPAPAAAPAPKVEPPAEDGLFSQEPPAAAPKPRAARKPKAEAAPEQPAAQEPKAAYTVAASGGSVAEELSNMLSSLGLSN